MNIGIVTERFYPESYADAIRFKSIVDKLQEDEDLEVTVHTSTASTGNSRYKVKQNFIPAPQKAGKYFRLINELLLAVELFFRLFLSKRYDLIVITSPPFFVMLSCSLAAFFSKTPYVLDIRDLYPRLFFSLGLLKEDSFIGNWATYFEETAYTNALGIVAATEGINENISNRIPERDKVVTVRNGYLKDIFKFSEEKYDRFTISFHGNIGRLQDIDLLLQIAKKCNDEDLDIEFIVIGDGAQSHLIERIDLKNLKYYGRLPNKETAKIISKAHVGISFRTNEFLSCNSFPVKVFEYIGAGLPIIMTPVSEGGDFVENNKIGYQFNPSEFDKIYEVIKDLFMDPVKMKCLKTNIKDLREFHSREFRSQKFYKFIVNKLNR